MRLFLAILRIPCGAISLSGVKSERMLERAAELSS